jgi:hypothetical protein
VNDDGFRAACRACVVKRRSRGIESRAGAHMRLNVTLDIVIKVLINMNLYREKTNIHRSRQ